MTIGKSLMALNFISVVKRSRIKQYELMKS